MITVPFAGNAGENFWLRLNIQVCGNNTMVLVELFGLP